MIKKIMKKKIIILPYNFDIKDIEVYEIKIA